MTEASLFQKKVLRWFDNFGRKDLPWQLSPTPYHVWLSEIMLQQTQVATVIPYYLRFIKQFPDLPALAKARLDQVLHLWAGLGYYARARNLHRTAQIIVDSYQGKFPADIDLLQALPGIGRSTAGAILALGFQITAPILDGNVRRVLSRVYAIDLPANAPQTLQQLWQIATQLTPTKRVAAYTQAMMDLGAMVCLRSKPLCQACPLAKQCMAYLSDKTAYYPNPKPKKQIPIRQIRMLMITNKSGAILLQKRPPVGIWGGLWSLPECPVDVDLSEWCQANLGIHIRHLQAWPLLRHTFSHFHLDITPVQLLATRVVSQVMENPVQVWYKIDQSTNQYALAAPIKVLLQQFAENHHESNRQMRKTPQRSGRLRKPATAR